MLGVGRVVCIGLCAVEVTVEIIEAARNLRRFSPVGVRSEATTTQARKIGSAILDWSDTYYWIAFGLAGNAAFATRFMVQWIASERAEKSVVPVSFWYLSIVGSLILLVYAIHRGDPVFTLAYLPNAAIYARNLVLTRRVGSDAG